MTKTKDGKRFTTYRAATNMIGNKIMCNNIGEIAPSIWDNLEFNMVDEDGNVIDIYQYFITDCNEADVEYLKKTFGLLFTYSDELDCYILCVDNFGTPWNGVDVQVLDDSISDDIVRKWEE